MRTFAWLRFKWQRLYWRFQQPSPLDYAPGLWTDNDHFCLPHSVNRKRYMIDLELWKAREPKDGAGC